MVQQQKRGGLQALCQAQVRRTRRPSAGRVGVESPMARMERGEGSVYGGLIFGGVGWCGETYGGGGGEETLRGEV